MQVAVLTGPDVNQHQRVTTKTGHHYRQKSFGKYWLKITKEAAQSAEKSREAQVVSDSRTSFMLQTLLLWHVPWATTTFRSEPNMRCGVDIQRLGDRAFAAAGPGLW